MSKVFPHFMINGQSVEFVQEFRYLGHILSQKMSDDSDIKREIRNMYMRTAHSEIQKLFHRCKD